MLVRSRGEVAQAVEAAPDPLIASAGASVMAQRAPLHPRRERLFGGEVAGLRFCDLVEAVVIDLVRHKGDIIPQTSDVTTTRCLALADEPSSLPE